MKVLVEAPGYSLSDRQTCMRLPLTSSWHLKPTPCIMMRPWTNGFQSRAERLGLERPVVLRGVHSNLDFPLCGLGYVNKESSLRGSVSAPSFFFRKDFDFADPEDSYRFGHGVRFTFDPV